MILGSLLLPRGWSWKRGAGFGILGQMGEQIVITQGDQDLLGGWGVEAVVLFGSRAQNLAGPQSDYDIGVILAPGVGKEQKRQIYDLIYEAAAKEIAEMVDIDIVFLDEAPGELLDHVCRFGQVMYEKNPGVFANFREKVMLDYADFAPLRRMFQEATLARISL